jgi:hypothetical protein
MSEGGGTGGPVIPGVAGLVEIGRTPAAITYRGNDASGAVVVVKVLQRDATAEVRSRFDYDQARLTELIDHPDIVNTVAHGYTDANQPYVVMEQLTGGSLASKVGSGMDGPGVLAIGVKLSGALESAHRRNLIHGDLRPEDVLVTDDGEPHLADLGVALVTGYGPDRASEPARIAHAAPEQLETHVPTTATDIYALGSVLHALLAGRPAFVRPGDTSPMAVAMRIANEPAPDLRPSGVPGTVIDVIDRAMAKNPAERWESAEAMGHALQQAEVTLGLPITPMNVIGAEVNPPRPAPTEPESAGGPSTPAGPPQGGGSKKGLLIGAGAVAVLALVGGFLAFGGGDDEEEPPPITRAPQEEIDLENASDDTGVITVGVLEKWDQLDGANLNLGGGILAPDLVAAEDSEGFLDDGGFAISGIEVTVFEADALPVVLDQFGLEPDAEGLLEFRVTTRDLADECNTDLEPRPEEIAGFDGLLQRFEGCDGSELAVFAGVDEAGRGLVVEAHLVDEEDQAALEPVLDSIQIA